MRWIANTVLIIAALISIFLITYNSADYDYITGFAIVELGSNEPTDCTSSSITTLWDNIFSTITSSEIDILGEGSECIDVAVAYNYTNNTNSHEVTLLILSYDSNNQNTLIGAYYSNFSADFNMPTTKSAIASLVSTSCVNRESTIDAAEASNLFNNFYTFSIGSTEWSGSFTFSNTSSDDDFERTYNVAVNDDTYCMNYVFTKTNSSLSFSGTIPNQTITEDSSATIDLDDYFTAGTPLTSSDFTYSFDSHISISIDSSNVLTIDPTEDWNGYTSAYINATSGVKTVGSNLFYVNVTPVEDSPRLIANISNQSFDSDTSKKLHLENYFYEPDGQNLGYYTVGLDHFNESYDLDDEEVTFTPIDSWVGTEELYLFANDTKNNTVKSNLFSLESRAVNGTNDTGIDNDPPVIVSKTPSIPDVTMALGESQTFSVVVNDTEDDILAYTWTLNGVNQDNDLAQFPFTTNSTGSYSVKVSVTDYYNTAVTHTWIVVVSASGNDTAGTDTTMGTPSGTTDQTVQIVPKSKNKLLFFIIGIVVLVIVIVVIIMLTPKLFGKKQQVTEVKGVQEKPTISPKPPPRLARKPGPDTHGRARKNFFEGLKFDELTSIVNFIKKYKLSGVDDLSIKEVLLKKGWKINDINEAFRRVR